MSEKKLYNLEAHPSVEPLDKNSAWNKLQAMRAQEPAAHRNSNRPTVLVWFSILAAACLLFLLIRSDQFLKEEAIPYHPAAPQPPVSSVKQAKEEPRSQEPVQAASQAVPRLRKPAPVRAAAGQRLLPTAKAPVNAASDAVPEQVQGIAAIPQADSMAAVVTTVSVEKKPLSAPRAVFHINELKDPDRPYTINQEKKRATPPVAAQERTFSIKINLSN